MPELFAKESLIKYEFTGKSHLYSANDACGWHFIFFPKDLAKEIRGNHKWQEEGWGRMKAIVKIGISEWKTSVWFDTKNDTYLLPVKAAIRKKEKIEFYERVDVAIWI